MYLERFRSNLLYRFFFSFAQAFGVCLSQIASASQLLEEVEERRGVKYSEENEMHEKLLLQANDQLLNN